MVGAEGGEAGVRAAKGEGVQPDGAPEKKGVFIV